MFSACQIVGKLLQESLKRVFKTTSTLCTLLQVLKINLLAEFWFSE